MSYSYTEKKRIRKNFGTFAKVMDLPNLIETQTKSYAEFLQADVAPDKRKKQGLEEQKAVEELHRRQNLAAKRIPRID